MPANETTARIEAAMEKYAPDGYDPASDDCTIPFAMQLVEMDAEIERLRLENWQLKGALGYPVPGDIPQGHFKCGLCEARTVEQSAKED